ncbi:MAG TPA: serine hydrolase domain-containing protein [Saprospiraceae bacterium]|nr:serine hydrolase domain-containing protein [Saprospiraceae bacterium]
MKSKFIIGIALIIYPFFFAISQQDSDFSKLVNLADSIFNLAVTEGKIPGGAITIVGSDTVILCKSYGWADVQNQIKATDTTLFQIGSVGKVFTSVAVLQLVEQNMLDLNRDVNAYLKDWKIKNVYPSPVTLKHLLTHSAGFNDRVIGYLSRSNESIEPLGVHLKNRMPSIFQEPGTEINYSNYSYGLAGHLVELKSNMLFQDYIEKQILEVLNMKSSTYYLPNDYEDIEQYAIGYRNQDIGFDFVKNYPRNVLPAGSIMVSVQDMATFSQMFLKQDRLLSESSFEKLLSPQFKVHPLLDGYTLAFEEQSFRGHQFFAKGGEVPGSRSALWVLPEHNISIFYVVNTQSDDFLRLLSIMLKEQLFLVPREADEKTKLFKASDTKELVGVYHSNRYNRETIEDFIALFLNPLDINLSVNGKLMAWLHRSYQEFEEIDEGVFQGIDNPEVKMVFKKVDGKWHLYVDQLIAGTTIPASFVKLPFYETPAFIDSGYPSIWIPIMLYPFILLWLLVVWIYRFRRPGFLSSKLLNISDHATASLFFICVLIHIRVFLFPMLKNPTDLFFGLPVGWVYFKYLHLFIVILTMALGYFCFTMWSKRRGMLLSRVYYTLFTLSAFFFIYFLYRWHFLSMTF